MPQTMRFLSLLLCVTAEKVVLPSSCKAEVDTDGRISLEKSCLDILKHEGAQMRTELSPLAADPPEKNESRLSQSSNLRPCAFSLNGQNDLIPHDGYCIMKENYLKDVSSSILEGAITFGSKTAKNILEEYNSILQSDDATHDNHGRRLYAHIRTPRTHWVHQGHCARGYKRGTHSLTQSSLQACARFCALQGNDVGYLAYRAKPSSCACYYTANNCPDDNAHNDHDAYRILRTDIETHWVHQGHCARGYKRGTHSQQSSLRACARFCALQGNDVGYLAYRARRGPRPSSCACYYTANNCPDDNRHNDHDAYRILRTMRHEQSITQNAGCTYCFRA